MGYQTFLYSSEHDTRRLLLFLVEKLPRDESERGAEPPGRDLGGSLGFWGGLGGIPGFFWGGGLTIFCPPGKSGALLRAIGARIKEQLGTPWVPPACRTPQLQRLQVSWGGGEQFNLGRGGQLID